MKPRLLIVDDDPGIVASLSERFAARGYSVLTASNGADALEKARQPLDVILLDLQLPKLDGLSVLRALRAEGIDTTVIVITAHGSVDKAVEAMREGAYDFLQKPFEPSLVEETVRRALERSDLRRRNEALRQSAADRPLIVADPAMEEVVRLAKKAAAAPSTVLLLGESGTGKEVLARKIHEWSPRAEGPFIAVNCVALAETLLESELFGHEKGSFTGATARKPGKIELAHGGTLFLDEIGDISPAFQTKLLRFLQERTFERVGGTQPIEIDVRVLAATHRDLKRRVSEGAFREDLFYRLNVITVTLPPLRDRLHDVTVLAEHFVQLFSREARRPALSFSPESLDLLRAHSWPGNIRELRNAIERTVALCEAETITPADLPSNLLFSASPRPTGGFHDQIETFRKRVLSEALEKSGGNQTKAAELLGLQRTYLARLVRQYGL